MITSGRTDLRRGTILLMVVGVVSILVALAVAFLTRMRSDSEEADMVLQVAQARIMLHAGMSFVQEASRLGYGRPGDPADDLRNNEAWGWIDVRDGTIGPKDNRGAPLWTVGTWPAPGTHRRAPMYRMARPPFAVQTRMAYNPINTGTGTATDYLLPVIKNPDPLPEVDLRGDWESGDLAPVQNSMNLGWFRVYREQVQAGTYPTVAGASSPTGKWTYASTEPDWSASDPAGRPANAGPAGATFIITVGAGATHGFKDWPEVVAAGAAAQALFGDSEDMFTALRKAELRQWFRVEWSASVGRGTTHYFRNHTTQGGRNGGDPTKPERLFDMFNHTMSSVNPNGDEASSYRSTAEPRNYVGTIRYIQRLPGPPANY